MCVRGVDPITSLGKMGSLGNVLVYASVKMGEILRFLGTGLAMLEKLRVWGESRGGRM